MHEAPMPRICVITTPGEITATREGFASPLDISPNLGRFADIDTVSFDKPGSVSMDLVGNVIKAIHRRRKIYDGFVVTGNAKSIQLLSERLAFAFGPGLDRTIAVTGTNIPAYEAHSAASVDLIRAAMVANTPFRESVIVYDNSIVRGSNSMIGRAGHSSIMAYLPYYPSDELGRITGWGVEAKHLRDFKPRRSTYNNDFQQMIAAFGSSTLEPEFIEPLISVVQGLVIQSTSFSLSSLDPYSCIPLIDTLLRRGIPVMVTSEVAYNSHTQVHRSQHEVIETLGAIAAKGMHPEVAMVKFRWVVKRVNDKIAAGKLPETQKLARIRELMSKSYVGEFGIYKPFNQFIRA